MRRALAGAVIAAVALTGCGNTTVGSNATDSREIEESAPLSPTPSETAGQSASESPSESATGSSDQPTGTTVEIEIEGDKITPNGERIEVGTGETVTLQIESDRAGELHVHSTPEQELEFDKGETTVDLTIDQPGIVDVEEHEAGVVVLQLEVS